MHILTSKAWFFAFAPPWLKPLICRELANWVELFFAMIKQRINLCELCNQIFLVFFPRKWWDLASISALWLHGELEILMNINNTYFSQKNTMKTVLENLAELLSSANFLKIVFMRSGALHRQLFLETIAILNALRLISWKILNFQPGILDS